MFNEFYGFMGREAHQYNPGLFRGTTPIEASEEDKNYHLTTDLVEKSLAWMNRQQAAAPDKLFFVYWAPGATHAPHHVAPKWVKLFEGKFDQGWDKLREESFERQRKLGVIPADAKLTPWHQSMPAWNTFDDKQKKIASQQMEVYSGFMAHTDNGPHTNTWPNAAMTPFRNEKNSNWECAYRVPAMLRWPGTIKQGAVSNEMVSHLDWLPTLAAVGGDADKSVGLRCHRLIRVDIIFSLIYFRFCSILETRSRRFFMSLPFSTIDPTKQALTLFDEFKRFAFKGNVIDLAVGVIIGGAFGKLIESLVKNLLMPLVSVIFGGDSEKATKGLESLGFTIRGVTIPFGTFLAEITNFLILAFVLFVFIVKFLGWVIKAKKEEIAEVAPIVPADIQLLTEIRDLLKGKS